MTYQVPPRCDYCQQEVKEKKRVHARAWRLCCTAPVCKQKFTQDHNHRKRNHNDRLDVIARVNAENRKRFYGGRF